MVSKEKIFFLVCLFGNLGNVGGGWLSDYRFAKAAINAKRPSGVPYGNQVSVSEASEQKRVTNHGHVSPSFSLHCLLRGD